MEIEINNRLYKRIREMAFVQNRTIEEYVEISLEAVLKIDDLLQTMREE